MKSTHRNQTTEPSSSVLEESLRVHGEAFMRMFDDSDEDEGEQAHAGAEAQPAMVGRHLGFEGALADDEERDPFIAVHHLGGRG